MYENRLSYLGSGHRVSLGPDAIYRARLAGVCFDYLTSCSVHEVRGRSKAIYAFASFFD